MFQAVTPADNLTGAGNVPSLDFRQIVGIENGTIWLNVATRANALSGRSSKFARLCFWGFADAVVGVGDLMLGLIGAIDLLMV